MARPIPPNSQTGPDQGVLFDPGIPENDRQDPWHGTGGNTPDEGYAPDDEDGYGVVRIPLFTDEQWNRLRRGLVEQHAAISEDILKSWGGLPPESDRRPAAQKPGRSAAKPMEVDRFWFLAFLIAQLVWVIGYLVLKLAGIA